MHDPGHPLNGDSDRVRGKNRKKWVSRFSRFFMARHPRTLTLRLWMKALTPAPHHFWEQGSLQPVLTQDISPSSHCPSSFIAA
jgi:hypothetical protein